MNDNQFAQNLEKLRKEKGISQAQLANSIGVSTGIVSLRENQKREPTLRSLLAIATYFQVDLNELVGFAE